MIIVGFLFSFKLKIIPNYRFRCVSIRFLGRIDSYLIHLVSLSKSESASPSLLRKSCRKKKISFNGNRRPIRYESWNEAIAIRNDGKIVLVSNNVLRFGCFMPMSHGVFIKKAPSIVSPQTPCSEKSYSRDTVICKEEMSFRNHYFVS